MDGEFVLRTLAFLVFAAAGYFMSRRFPAPRQPLVWVAWLAATLFVGSVGVSARLIDILGFVFYLSNSLQGLGFGLLAGWLMSAMPTSGQAGPANSASAPNK